MRIGPYTKVLPSSLIIQAELWKYDVRNTSNRSGLNPSELILEIHQFLTCQVLLCKHRSVDLYTGILNMIIVWLPQKKRVPVEEHPQETVRVFEALGFNRRIFFSIRHLWTAQIIPRNMKTTFPIYLPETNINTSVHPAIRALSETSWSYGCGFWISSSLVCCCW